MLAAGGSVVEVVVDVEVTEVVEVVVDVEVTEVLEVVVEVDFPLDFVFPLDLVTGAVVVVVAAVECGGTMTRYSEPVTTVTSAPSIVVPGAMAAMPWIDSSTRSASSSSPGL